MFQIYLSTQQGVRIVLDPHYPIRKARSKNSQDFNLSQTFELDQCKIKGSECSAQASALEY